MQPYSLSTLLFIHPSPYLFLGLMLFHILLNLSTILFSHIHPNLLNGPTHQKGGDLNLSILLIYYLHPYCNYISLILIHLSILKFLLNQIRTPTTSNTTYLQWRNILSCLCFVNLGDQPPVWSVLPDNHPHSPPKDIEEEKEKCLPQLNLPMFLERLIHPIQHTP